MNLFYAKRGLSLLLAVILVFSLMPIQAMATETEPENYDHESQSVENNDSDATIQPQSEPEAVSVPTDNTQLIQEQIDALLIQFGITDDMTDQQIADVIIVQDSTAIQSAMEEMTSIEERAQLLTEEELELLDTDMYGRFVSVMEQLYNPAPIAETSIMDGQISIYASKGTITVSDDGKVTIVNKISGFSFYTGYTFKITNNCGTRATISFDYSVTNFDTIPTPNRSGTYPETTLNAGEYIELSGSSKCGAGGQTDTLVLSNFKLTKAAANSAVKFSYNTDLGSVTVGGNTVANNATEQISVSTGAVLAATPKTGATFMGWINADTQELLSKDASFTLIPLANMTVTPVFRSNSSTTPYFLVGYSNKQEFSYGLGFEIMGVEVFEKKEYYTITGTHIFDNLPDATAAANASGSSKHIVLMNSGILPAGNYTIPFGVTLLIPFDANNTLYTTAAQPVNVSTRATPTAFRTLTMASGANITVNGSLGLSAKVYSANGGHRCAGMPYVNYGHIKMERNSSISVGNGGNMYVYGYITGSGEVTAASGATLYESFVIEDFRGGTQTTKMKNGVFPFNQYYIQSIEVPLTINSGANLHAYTCLNMSNYDFPMDLIFLGSGTAMFKLSSGSAKKWYDGSQDRLHIEINGNMSISPIDLEISGTTINSEDYELPVNGNISISLNTGKLTIAQDLAILPGTQIDIAENASVELGSGTSAYVYDGDNWGNFSGATPQPFIPAYYAPSRTYTRTTADLVDASINVLGTWDASKGYVYTTSGGANIHSKGNGIVMLNKGAEETAYQLVQGTGNTEIPITPAKLKHEDGSYLETDSGTYNHDHYTCAHDSTGTAAAHGKWYAGDHNITNSITTAASCTNDGKRTYACPCGYSYTEVIPATGHTEVIDEAVPATCTETGLTEGKHCSVCNTVLEAQQTVPVLSHSYSNWVVTTKPGLTTVGMQTGSCVCGDTDTVEFTSCHIGDTNYLTLAEALEDVGVGGTIYLDAEFNSVEVIPVTQHVIFDTTKGSASITGGAASDGWIYKRIDGTNTITIQKATVEVMFTNIAVNDGLDLHFYVNSVDLMDNVTYTAVVTKHFSDGRNDSVKTIPAAAWVPDSSSLKEFVFEDISAKEMTDAIEVKIYQDYGTENQLQVNTTLTETVQKYVIRTLRDISKEATLSEKDALLRTALVDMLCYGSAAQSFFGYNSEVLATEEPTGLKSDFLGVLADNLQYATSDVKTLASSQIKGSNFAGVTVSATNKLMFTFYFNISDPTGMEATVTYTDHNGKPQSRTVLGEDFYKRSTGLYGVDVLNMSIVDGRQLMNCKVSLNGNEIARASDSVEGYAARKTDGNNDIFEQMMKFVDSACAYFDKVKATKNS